MQALLHLVTAAVLVLLGLAVWQVVDTWTVYRDIADDGDPGMEGMGVGLALVTVELLIAVLVGLVLMSAVPLWLVWQVLVVRNAGVLGYSGRLVRRLTGVWLLVVAAATGAALLEIRYRFSDEMLDSGEVPPMVQLGAGAVSSDQLARCGTLVLVLAAVLVVAATVRRWTREQDRLVQAEPPRPDVLVHSS